MEIVVKNSIYYYINSIGMVMPYVSAVGVVYSVRIFYLFFKKLFFILPSAFIIKMHEVAAFKVFASIASITHILKALSPQMLLKNTPKKHSTWCRHISINLR